MARVESDSELNERLLARAEEIRASLGMPSPAETEAEATVRDRHRFPQQTVLGVIELGSTWLLDPRKQEIRSRRDPSYGIGVFEVANKPEHWRAHLSRQPRLLDPAEVNLVLEELAVYVSWLRKQSRRGG